MKVPFFQKRKKEAQKVPVEEQPLSQKSPQDTEWSQVAEMQLEELPENPQEKKFRRKRRKVEKEETATVEEIKAAATKSFFRSDVNEKKEKDFLAKSAEGTGIMASLEDSEDVNDMLEVSKEIADIFDLKDVLYTEPEQTTSDFFKTAEKPKESDLEEFLEGEPENLAEDVIKSHVWSSNSILERLHQLTEEMETGRFSRDNEYCKIAYDNSTVPEVVERNKALELSSYHVFVDGKRKYWDDLFEVRIPAGSTVVVETGVSLRVPEGITIELSGTEGMFEKFALEQIGENIVKSGEPIIATFKAGEGAYLSKVGRLVSCRLIG